MSGDNTVGMKMNRAYQRLLVAILDNSPDWVINTLFAEVQGWAVPCKIELEEIKQQSNNYILIFQGGRARPIPKNSPFAKVIMFGKKSRNAKSEKEDA